MASGRLLTGLFCAAVIVIAFSACGGDETTTVTETAAGGDGATVAETETGTGEAAEEEIAEPSPEAQEEIDAITGAVEAQAEGEDAGDFGRRLRAIRRRFSGEVSGGAPPPPDITKAAAALDRARYCAQGVVAGPNTSCAFAINVAYDYFALGRAKRFISYSPVTGQYYRVRCKGTHPTICRAGNGALIAIA